ETRTCDAAEESFLVVFRDDPKIDLSDILAPGLAEFAPRSQRSSLIRDPKRLSKVVAAAFGDHQRGNLAPVKLRQIAMHGAVATKDEGSVNGLNSLQIGHNF